MARVPHKVSRTVVGLDIQANQIVAVDMATDHHSVKKAGISPLEPGLVKDGYFMDLDSLGSALRAFFKEHGLGKNIRLGVANQRVVVRQLDIPVLKDRKELEAAVRFAAADKLPMPIEEAVIDYQVIGEVVAESGATQNRIVVVAAPKELVERMVAVTKKAGLKLVGIDLDTFALIRALYRSGDRPTDLPETAAGPPEGTATAYCHLGSVTSLAIAHGSVCYFARTVQMGIDTLVSEICEQHDISAVDAHRLMVEAAVKNDDPDSDGRDEIRAHLEDGAARIASEVQASFDYYSSLATSLTVDRTLFTGPGADIPGLADAVGKHLPGGAAVSIPELVQHNGHSPNQIALAYGLALSEVAA